MRTGKNFALPLLLLMIPLFLIPAQTNTTQADNIPSIFQSAKVPQWVKDLRRWEIIAFGSIPFTMLTATFAMDMYRWQNANGMNFSDEGRRYAPWPIKSAGAIVMESEEQQMVFIIAAGLSIGIAMADQVIFQIKRYRARKRAEALPAGTVIISRTPWAEEDEDVQDNTDEGAVPIIPESSSPEQP